MFKNIPKEPVSFGVFITKFHKKWAFIALFCVFFATAFDRSSVIILKYLTDSITAKTLVIDTIWFWAIAYPATLLASHVFWRGSGFSGMRWFMNYRATAYQSLYGYLTLHSKDFLTVV